MTPLPLPPSPQPLYLPCEPDPAFATLHLPSPQATRNGGVILCPPFGWEEVCSYRSLRFWAMRLAEEGYPALRVSLPSTGDSAGSPEDPGRVAAWTGALETAARWLRAETRVDRVTAIGVGMGGLLAVRAAQAPGGIDDLVLWGVPATGRTLIRQLRAFSKLERTHFFNDLPSPPAAPPGRLEAGGFVLSAETVDTLNDLSLAELSLPPDPRRRMMLLERDGLAVDATLRGHLAGLGELQAAPGDGYGDMTSHPQRARPPLAVIDRVNRWLHDGSEPMGCAAASGAAALPPASAVFGAPGGSLVRETAIWVPQASGRLSGILVTPAGDGVVRRDLCVVLLNAGAVRRTGPNRMWVEAARRWAEQGASTLRLDVEAIGDSDGDETPYADDGALYAPKFVPQVLSALDLLAQRGVAQRFVLGGLCSGAYWSFHAALEDPRVSGVLMVNPRALVFDTGLGPARDLRALFAEPLSPAYLKRVVTGPRLWAFLRWALAAPRRWVRRLRTGQDPAAAAQRELSSALERFIESGKRALLLFSEHEPVYDELVQWGLAGMLGGVPQVTIERIAVRDHTLRPSWGQEQAHAALDRALSADTPAPVKTHQPLNV